MKQAKPSHIPRLRLWPVVQSRSSRVDPGELVLIRPRVLGNLPAVLRGATPVPGATRLEGDSSHLRADTAAPCNAFTIPSELL